MKIWAVWGRVLAWARGRIDMYHQAPGQRHGQRRGVSKVVPVWGWQVRPELEAGVGPCRAS